MFAAPVDRRADRRHSTQGFIRWTGDDPSYARDGWLCDCSMGGIAFTTARGDAPSPGDRIRILGGDSTQPRLAVRRVKQLGNGSVMVACADC